MASSALGSTQFVLSDGLSIVRAEQKQLDQLNNHGVVMSWNPESDECYSLGPEAAAMAVDSPGVGVAVVVMKPATNSRLSLTPQARPEQTVY